MRLSVAALYIMLKLEKKVEFLSDKLKQRLHAPMQDISW